MSQRRLEVFLSQHRVVGIDTSVFIFHVEAHPKYLSLTQRVFIQLETVIHGVTSTITMLELLVQPYRVEDFTRVNQFYALLSTYPNLSWVVPTLEIVDMGARLRAEFNLKTPDAIQAATAITAQATGFISNDPSFKRIKGLEVFILDEGFG